MPRIWRAGVIGCGKMAQVAHLPGYLKCAGVKLAAACDPEPKRLAEARRICRDLAVYRDYREMLDAERLDVVSVVSPNRFHADHAVAALEHGAHVLLEKPPVLSMEDVTRIKRVLKRTGRRLIVGFSNRFARGNRKLHKLLTDGAIGRPFMIRIRFAHSGPYPRWGKSDWFYEPKLAGGGALFDMGIHAIDLALWLLGPVKRVQAMARTLRWDIRVDDNAVLLLEFADGKALGYIEVGWTSPSGFAGIEVMGDRGSIVQNHHEALALTTGTASADVRKQPKFRTRVIDRAPTTGGWRTEIGEVVKAFRRGDDLGMGIDTGGQALAVALAAYESSRTGRAVKVSGVK